MLGVFVVRSAGSLLPIGGGAGALTLPLAGTAVLALLVATAAAVTVASEGRIACVANRSTTVRKAVRPMMIERSKTPGEWSSIANAADFIGCADMSVMAV
jgi:hypothetical protein